MDIMTNTIDSIIRLIKMFMQYARRLIISPVVSSDDTIIFAPIQLIRRMHEYTVSCISGAFTITLHSAFTKIL